MEFFKTTLILEDFLKLLRRYRFQDDNSFIKSYKNEEWIQIRDDFNIQNRRITRPTTIIKHIYKIGTEDQIRQKIIDKFNKIRDETRYKIDYMSTRSIRNELESAGISNFSGTTEEIQVQLKQHRNSTLAWDFYTSEKLFHELKTHNIKIDKQLEKHRNDSREINRKYIEYAAKLLDFYESGELIVEDFETEANYTDYVKQKTTEFKIDPTPLALIKYILEKQKALTNGDIEELKGRLIRFQEKRATYSDMNDDSIKRRLKVYGGLVKETEQREILIERLSRFKKNIHIVEDYSDEWLRSRLEKCEPEKKCDDSKCETECFEKLSRSDLVYKYKITVLRKENKKLYKDLENCRRQHRSSTYKSNSSPDKKKSSGPGFGWGMAVGGAIGMLAGRYEEKTMLKF